MVVVRDDRVFDTAHRDQCSALRALDIETVDAHRAARLAHVDRRHFCAGDFAIGIAGE
jgi:hypothetical protein